MSRFFQFAILSLSIIALAGCSSMRRLDLSKAATQLQVGVRAARDNLWREALFRFQRAVQIDPENAMAQNNLAVAYEGIGEFEKARLAYTEALRLDRSNQFIQKNYSRFVEFYSKNRKREKKIETVAVKEELEKKEGTSETPPQPPTLGAPEPSNLPPVTNPEPPKQPVSTPPVTTKPDSPSKGATP